jgi:hypothetical protein
MPNLLPFRGGLPTKVFYQPFDLRPSGIKSADMLISHSPFHEKQMRFKGTSFIKKTVEDLNIDFDLITGASWSETLARKSLSHIFIDQIQDGKKVATGVGKSGLEAMLLKCMVMSEAVIEDCEDIPAPPVVYTTKERLRDDILTYVHNDAERHLVIEEQYEWASTYLNYDFIAKRMLNI